MSSRITVSYQNKDYVLEYSRQSVRQMEQTGFVLEQVSEKPMTMIPLLVYGAFLKNNKGIKRALVDEIYDNICDKVGDDEKEGFVQVLLEMYAETLNTLTDNKADGDEGNAATWTVAKG